jgi:hypothetical protein
MAIVGDMVASPYIRRDREVLEAIVPAEVGRVTVTHGGSTFSAYLWIDGERVAESHGSRTVLAAVRKAADAYGRRNVA